MALGALLALNEPGCVHAPDLTVALPDETNVSTSVFDEARSALGECLGRFRALGLEEMAACALLRQNFLAAGEALPKTVGAYALTWEEDPLKIVTDRLKAAPELDAQTAELLARLGLQKGFLSEDGAARDRLKGACQGALEVHPALPNDSDVRLTRLSYMEGPTLQVATPKDACAASYVYDFNTAACVPEALQGCWVFVNEGKGGDAVHMALHREGSHHDRPQAYVVDLSCTDSGDSVE